MVLGIQDLCRLFQAVSTFNLHLILQLLDLLKKPTVDKTKQSNKPVGKANKNKNRKTKPGTSTKPAANMNNNCNSHFPSVFWFPEPKKKRKRNTTQQALKRKREFTRLPKREEFFQMCDGITDAFCLGPGRSNCRRRTWLYKASLRKKMNNQTNPSWKGTNSKNKHGGDLAIKLQTCEKDPFPFSSG